MKKIKNKIDRMLSLAIAKKPERVLIIGIFILNIILVFGAAAFLVVLFPEQLQGDGFWRTAYNVFTMILDAGCIAEIVNDSTTNAFLPIVCIAVILIGTLSFTGAIIGYLSNRISDFISEANKGTRRLYISDHIVIINWNNRASEIINDLLFSDYEEKVVILVNNRKEEIELEIQNRIADTEERERERLSRKADELIKNGIIKKSAKHKYINDNYSIRKITIIVRQGEVYSLKQLNDVSVSTAKNIIILGKNENDGICKYNSKEYLSKYEKGNIDTIKSLVQISEITSAQSSADNQKVVVEVEDKWTMTLVKKIIEHKQVDGKCNIIPVPVNKILGQILSQFSIMPELNSVYSELFSNKGATFYSCPFEQDIDENDYISDYLKDHDQALPIATMQTSQGRELFYIACNNESLNAKCSKQPDKLDVKLNPYFRFERKHIAIIGHNSKSLDILEGFYAFLNEWANNDEELVDIIIIDNKEHLEKVGYYEEFREKNGKQAIVKDVVEAEVYDYDIIIPKLNDYIDSHPEDTSILILSDDLVSEAELDSNALTYLVYVQDILHKRAKEIKDFDVNSIDVIVELINPKNHDVVTSYSVNNVIISNRYISRMIVQISEKESIYEFYKDILTYDRECGEDGYSSKELYIKNVEAFFDKDTAFPIVTNPRDLVSAVFYASPDNNKSIVLGMIKKGDTTHEYLFADSKKKEIKIEKDDKLILFAPH